MSHLDGPLLTPQVGTPGPLRLVDRQQLESVAREAGWDSMQVTPADELCDVTDDGATDGVEERLRVLLSGAVGQHAHRHIVAGQGHDTFDRLRQIAVDQLRERMPTVRRIPVTRGC